jgi:hypothetical protein
MIINLIFPAAGTALVIWGSLSSVFLALAYLFITFLVGWSIFDANSYLGNELEYEFDRIFCNISDGKGDEKKYYLEILHLCEDKIREGVSLKRINKILADIADESWKMVFVERNSERYMELQRNVATGRLNLAESKFSKTKPELVNIAKRKLGHALSDFVSVDKRGQSLDLIEAILFALNYLSAKDIDSTLKEHHLQINIKNTFVPLLEPPSLRLVKQIIPEVVEEKQLYEFYTH